MSDSSRNPLNVFVSHRSTEPIRRPPEALLEKYQCAIQELMDWLQASRHERSARPNQPTPHQDDLVSPGFHIRLPETAEGHYPPSALEGKYIAWLERLRSKSYHVDVDAHLVLDHRLAHLTSIELAERVQAESAKPSAVTFLTEGMDRYESEFLQSVLASHLPALVRAARQDNAQQRIQQLLQAVAPTDPMAEIHLRMAEDTASLRAEFFETITTLTSTQVAEKAGFKKNAYQTVHRWRSAKKIFAVRHGGHDRYPTFQFSPEEGLPLPVMAVLLEILGRVASRSDWDNAFWFAGGNGWLGGKAPFELLKDEPAKVVKAALQEVLPDVE